MKKYHHTEYSDSLIRLAYKSRKRTERRSYIEKAAFILKANHGAIYKRAIEIGAHTTKTKEDKKFWTPQELEIVETSLKNTQSVFVIYNNLKKAGFSRTIKAIYRQVNDSHGGFVQARIDAGFNTVEQTSKILGVHKNTVINWITKGWLKAKKITISENENATMWEITNKNLKEFIIENPSMINKSACDFVYIVDILTNAGADV